jgi:acetaldehyde dehydrogenase
MSRAPLRVAVIGTGHIGTDLAVKLARENSVELVIFAGIDPDSEGMAFARSLGIPTTADGIDAVLDAGAIDVAFDATSAKVHAAHAPLLEGAGIAAVDLTPAALGPMVVPVVNFADYRHAPNVNLVSCAAQATIPLAAAVASVAPLTYVETVTTISSLSAGPGTRNNIDEFTSKTKRALSVLTGAPQAKAIAILNPAEPPKPMHNTVYMVTSHPVDPDDVQQAVSEMTSRVQAYVPGYSSMDVIVSEDSKVTIYNEVWGSGDYLPKYSGNLDIITAAATAIAVARSNDRDPSEQSRDSGPSNLQPGRQ